MSESGTIAVESSWDVRIPMRDGIHLSACVYRAVDATDPTPVIIVMTPYTTDTHHDLGVFFAARGLAFAIVDVRGRGNSEGSFNPLVQEANDGHDVVEWFSGQPYCSGRVGMWGGSYSGHCQWAAARRSPRHLGSLVPAAAPYIGVDFPMRNNIFYPYVIQWLSLVSGRSLQTRMFADRQYWSSIYSRWHRSGKSFRELGRGSFDRESLFQEWLDHPQLGPYWDAHNPTESEYRDMTLPILTITGSYDDDQPGALEHYRRHLRSQGGTERARHYLIIGPWDHSGTRRPQRDFGGLSFGPESQLDLQQLHLDWYRWTLAEGPKPAFLQAPVAYYVMGAERWRYAEKLEQATSHHCSYYLGSSADPAVRSGCLSLAMPEDEFASTYSYDPAQMTDAEIAAEAQSDPGSLVDQSTLTALGARALIYDSAPLQEDTEVSGFFRLTAWIGIDCPDTDLYVSVHEVSDAGDSIRLSTDALRARYRQDFREAHLITSRDPLLYEFCRFTFVSRVIRRGHRLRLVIAPIGRLIEGTFVQKSYNAGGDVASESIADARPVTVRVCAGPNHLSVLHVPIGRPVCEVSVQSSLS